ncbi:transmembrane protease serine 9-like [Sitodiplosis mosellana]|uniref:transmembrane protease serine 9-like n=1 Tax=Sitodiplosis mosellana TaxID=263140 RepID=UPI00244487E4|nr:transmembrane protease serine 9-like [Sitodiplosis mosellana]
MVFKRFPSRMVSNWSNVVFIFLSICVIAHTYQIIPRIVNGDLAYKSQFRFYTFLQIYEVDSTKAVGCGGALITSEFVLTAAHCLAKARKVRVLLGVTTLNSYEEPGMDVITDSQIHIDFTFTRTNEPSSIDLRFASLHTTSIGECRRQFPFLFLRRSVLCAKSYGSKTQAIAKGDSGSPLVRTKDNKLIGVGSFSKPNCNQRKPQAFTNIILYHKWISDITGLELPNCLLLTRTSCTVSYLENHLQIKIPSSCIHVATKSAFINNMKLIIVALITISRFAIEDASEIEPKIVRGYTARAGQFKFFAFLSITLTSGESSACGSSLISDEWLITAAHCIADARKLTAHLGIADLRHLSADPPIVGHVAIPVLKFGLYPHPGFFWPIAWNDIALIRLPRKVQFSDYIQPVKLSTTCKIPEKTESIAIGNGAINDKSGLSPQLQYAILKTAPLKVCRKVYPLLFWRKSVICASNGLQQQSICRGDSGGPLISRSNHTLIGLSSFVRLEGCETGLPQGFTNIHSYFEWIRQVTGLEVPNC